jgi:TPR repeat protein
MPARALLLLILCAAACGRGSGPATTEPPPPETAACEAGDAGACAKLQAELDKGCGAGKGTSCRLLALFHLAGRSGAVDKPAALRLYTKGCASGDGQSCRDAAAFQPETPEADQLLQTGCDRGDGWSCSELVAALRTAARDPGRSDAAFRRALQLFDKACEDGRPEGCMGVGHMHGSFAPPDEAKATRYYRRAVDEYEKACEKSDAASCFKLALAYHEGRGVDTDFNKNLELMTRACGLGYTEACAEQAAGYKTSEATDDDAQAPALFERACRAGVQRRQPCKEAGFMYADGDHVPADKPKGLELLLRACALDEASSCLKAGSMLKEGDGVPADAAKAASLIDPYLSALEIKVASVKRMKEAVDPATLQMGVGPADMPPVKANAGEDLIVVSFDVRRTAPKGSMPVRTVWVLDEKGGKHAGTLKNDFAFGLSHEYQREMVFRVPEGTRPSKVKFELGSLTLALPPAVKAVIPKEHRYVPEPEHKH